MFVHSVHGPYLFMQYASIYLGSAPAERAGQGEVGGFQH